MTNKPMTPEQAARYAELREWLLDGWREEVERTAEDVARKHQKP